MESETLPVSKRCSQQRFTLLAVLVPWVLCLVLVLCLCVALLQQQHHQPRPDAPAPLGPADAEGVTYPVGATSGARALTQADSLVNASPPISIVNASLSNSIVNASVNAHGAECGIEAEAEKIPQEDALPFLFSAIGTGTAVMQLSTNPRFAWLQETVCLFLIGLGYTLVVQVLVVLLEFDEGGFGTSWAMWMDINPDLLLSVMLPILITGDSISIDTSIAKRVAKQCIYLAGPGVLGGSVVMAGFLDVFLWQRHWSFVLCLTVSSILAATDPVATVGLLKELGASPSLTVQIQGESLLNDGVAMVLFSVSYRTLAGEVFTIGDIIIFLVKTIVCAVLLGLCIGHASVFWLRFAADRLDHRSSIIQISITICCPYVAWMSAERVFEVSGVLTVVTSSLVLAERMWPHIVEKAAMNNVWHTLEFIGNSVIFFVAGALTGTAMFGMEFVDFVLLIVIYGICMAVRGAMLYCSIPILNLLGDPAIQAVTFSDATVMTWGGLRGALGLALAIKVRQDLAEGTLAELEGKRVLFYVGGIAFLTLVINATTCPMLVKALRLNRPPGSKQILMINLHRSMSDMSSGSAWRKFDDSTRELLASMLEEVGHEIDTVVDHAAVALAAVTARQNSCEMQHQLSNQRSSTRNSLVGRASTLGPGDAQEDEITTRGWASDLWGKRQMNATDPLPRARDIHKRWARARASFLSIPESEHSRFGVDLAEDLIDINGLQRTLKDLGDTVSSEELKPINETFVQLMGKQILTEIDKGEMLASEQNSLRDCLAGAYLYSATKLITLPFVKQKLSDMLRQNEDDAALAIVEDVQSVQTRPSHGGNSASVSRRLSRSQSDMFTSQDSVASAAAAGFGSNNSFGEHIKDRAVVFLASARFKAFELFVIAVNTILCTYVALNAEPGKWDKHPEKRVVAVILFCYFIVDVSVKTYVRGPSRYLKSNWNRLDVIMTFLALVALVVQCVEAAGHTGALDTKIFEALTVLQLPRMHHFTRVGQVKEQIKRIALSEADPKQAGRVQATTVLLKFVEAHIVAQSTLLKYFGRKGKVESCVVARCMTESMTEVYKALLIGYHIWRLVDERIMESLRDLSHASRATQKLIDQVEEAHHSGCLTEAEAEKLTHPMRLKMKTFTQLRIDRHEGIVPLDTEDSVGYQRQDSAQQGTGSTGMGSQTFSTPDVCSMVDAVQRQSICCAPVQATIAFLSEGSEEGYASEKPVRGSTREDLDEYRVQSGSGSGDEPNEEPRCEEEICEAPLDRQRQHSAEAASDSSSASPYSPAVPKRRVSRISEASEAAYSCPEYDGPAYRAVADAESRRISSRSNDSCDIDLGADDRRPGSAFESEMSLDQAAAEERCTCTTTQANLAPDDSLDTGELWFVGDDDPPPPAPLALPRKQDEEDAAGVADAG